MIRPCVAPIKPKTLKESELCFQQPFKPTNHNQFTIVSVSSPKGRTEINGSPQHNSFPAATHLDSERTGRIFQRTEHKNQKINQKMVSKLKQHIQQLAQSILLDNKNELKLMRKDMADLRQIISGLNQKYKNCSQDSLKRTISGIVNNLTEGKKLVSLKEGIKIQNRLNTLEQKIISTQKYYVQNMQKAYTEVKQITVCMQAISNRLQNLQHDNLTRLANVQQRVRVVQSLKQDALISSNASKKLNLSKVNLQEPKSILSNYEKSQIKQVSYQVKQQSFIKKLDNIQGSSSQMIMISQQGNVTDIRGLPIIDGSGNVVVVNLKQIKKILQNESD